MPKIRLDQYLVSNGLAKNLQEASSLCIRGLVHDQSSKLLKPGLQINPQRRDIQVKQLKNHNYVSRAALKLKQAISHFNVDIKNKICADLGCSTGGFTEVLLEAGAKTIFAIDVAYGVFAHKLRHNPNIVLLERTNVKFLDKNLIPLELDIICCDLSFIGLSKALTPALSLLKSRGSLIALIKPQFELPKHLVEEGGIIKNPLLHQQSCNTVRLWLEQEQNMQVFGIIPCNQLGTKGNQEFLLHAVKN